MAKVQELASSAQMLTKKKKKKIDYLEEGERIFGSMLLDLQNHKIKQVESKREFRTSSLPFCPILDFLKEPQEESYAKSHYTSTGTAIHETIQSWMSMSPHYNKIMWGNWQCTGCGAIKKHQFIPKKPCDCSFTKSTTPFHRNWPKHWTYSEVEYNFHGLSGHIDMILRPELTWAVVPDFKTTELQKKMARAGWTQDKVSSLNYVAQIRTYCTVLDLQFKLPVKAWMLANVERGKPIQTIRDVHLQGGYWDRNKSLKWAEILQNSIDNNKRLVTLEEAVANSDKDTAKTALQRIVKNRPCMSEEDYERYMKYKFTVGECPRRGVCCGGSDKSVYRSIMNELSNKS